VPHVVHTIPVNDLIEHLTNGEDCPCGPTVKPLQREDGSIGYQYLHHSLDGREFREHELSITCPVCKMTSYHPKDVEHGYCGNCHAFTRGEVNVMTVDETPSVMEQIATNNWEWLPWPAKVVVVVVLFLLVVGLLWLLIFGEV
jgi:hypothetical protein